jgi:hypothetical protein
MPPPYADLPMPGSPEISTSWPFPALVRAQRRSSRSISSSRPISRVSADPRNAFEAARDGARTQYLPSRHRGRDALDLYGSSFPRVRASWSAISSNTAISGLSWLARL